MFGTRSETSRQPKQDLRAGYVRGVVVCFEQNPIDTMKLGCDLSSECHVLNETRRL